MDKHRASTKQNLFLKRIEDLLGASTSLVYELSDQLKISTDSAYRRIRGETLLSIDEIIILCDHFNVSFDAFSRAETDLVTFAYKSLENKQGNLLEYLQSIYTDLSKIKAFPDSHVIYACQDIPVFYHYNHTDIAAFKFFYWMRSIMNIPELDNQKYCAKSVDPEIFSVAKKIYELYAGVNSTEIWTDATIQSTIKQIGFYWESGIFNNKREALSVCESLRTVISDIQKQAESGTKFCSNSDISPKKYELYFSEIEITNNCVLVNLGTAKAVYLSHFSFYTMKTMNDIYCTETEDWLKSFIKKTTLISGSSEKTRYQFFNKMFNCIDNLMDKINKDRLF